MTICRNVSTLFEMSGRDSSRNSELQTHLEAAKFDREDGPRQGIAESGAMTLDSSSSAGFTLEHAENLLAGARPLCGPVRPLLVEAITSPLLPQQPLSAANLCAHTPEPEVVRQLEGRNA